LAEDAPPVRRWRLEIKTWDGQINCQLEGFDGAGRRQASAYLFVGARARLEVGASIIDRLVSSRVEADNVDSIPLPNEYIAAREVFAGHVKVLPKWFTNPEDHEPLNVFCRAGLAGLVKSESRCVAVDVSEYVFQAVHQAIKNDRIEIPVMREILSTWTPYVRTEAASWVVWRPLDPLFAEAGMADRRLLGRFARQRPGTELDDVYEVAHLVHDASPMDSYLADSWASWRTRASEKQELYAQLPDDIWRTLGAISTGAWNRLLGGATLSVGDCSAVREFTQAIMVPVPQAQIPSVRLTDTEHHAPELFPSGGLDQAQIRVVSHEIQSVNFWDQRAPEPSAWILEKNLPSDFRFAVDYKNEFSETPELRHSRREYEDQWSVYRFRRGHARTLEVWLGLPKHTALVYQVGFPLIAERDSVDFKDLPTELKDQIWKSQTASARARAQQSRANANSPLPKGPIKAVPPEIIPPVR
jgi:hypothetical protein